MKIEAFQLEMVLDDIQAFLWIEIVLAWVEYVD